MQASSGQGGAGGALRAACLPTALAAAVVLLGASVDASSAWGDRREADPLSLGPLPPRPAAGPVRDRVIESRPDALRSAPPADTRVYHDQHGHSIRIRVSDAYADPTTRAQELADFLGTVPHGNEISDLTATLATPRELAVACGRRALACYFPSVEGMVVSGENAPPGEPPRELVIAHEYGHHLAANRSNKPWRALNRGPKQWSSHENICNGIARGRIDPDLYVENPGEAFAEAFAFRRFPGAIPWGWRIAHPDARSFEAIDADVGSPWSGRTAVEWSGRLNRRDRRDVRRVATPLDGRLRVNLDGPPRARFNVAVLAAKRGRVLRRSVGRGPTRRLTYTVCGKRRVRIIVRRVRGAGTYELTARRP